MYSGLQFIVLKFTGRPFLDTSDRQPPSGVIWILGLYVAAFGFADQQYNKAVDSAVLLTKDTPKYPKFGYRADCAAFDVYVETVKTGPVRPQIFRPLTVGQAIFGERVPLMDEKFNYARRAEGSALLSLMFYSLGTDAVQDPIARFEGFDYFEGEWPYKYGQELIPAFVGAISRIDGLRTQYAITIDADDAGQMLEACQPYLANGPLRPKEYLIRFACALTVLGSECAAELRALDSDVK